MNDSTDQTMGELDLKSRAEVMVPHTWGVMAAYSDYDGLAWYRRTFAFPEQAQNAHLRLHFAAVFYIPDVWLNGAIWAHTRVDIRPLSSMC